MSEWSPAVVKVEKVDKHPNADALDIVITSAGDYPVVVRRGDYNVGDLAGYVSIETIVPSTEQFYFLCPQYSEAYEENGEIKRRNIGPKYGWREVPETYRRIKAKKIRGIYSIGMLVSTPEISQMQVGDSIVELLSLTKYEEEEEDNLPSEKKKKHVQEEKPPLGWSIPYYDIESLRKYTNCFVPNEEIVINEKIHGCLKHDSKVQYFDGTKKSICQVNVGDILLGVTDGKLVPSKITHRFNNGSGNNWLRILGTRTHVGRGGGGTFSLTCTEEHRFFSSSKNNYVRAHELEVGEKVLVLRSDYSLSSLQKQILLGKLLGDGCLRIHSKISALVEWSHTKKDIGYFHWTRQGIGSIDSGSIDEKKSGYNSDMIKGRTLSSPLIKNVFESMIKDGKKIVPEWVADELTPIAIAFWYMDDGSLSHHLGQEDRAQFAVCNFSQQDCEVLLRGLKKFNIDGKYFTTYNNSKKSHSRIRLNADNAEKLFLLIAPYIPPCMQRKLPERYRDHNGWLPSKDEYKPVLVEQTIISCEKMNVVNSYKYDIETSTHNYFANGVLVHNSNASFCYDGSKLWTKSRRFFKREEIDVPIFEEFISNVIKETGEQIKTQTQVGTRIVQSTDQWWDVAHRYDLKNKLSEYPGFVFFGEIYGQIKSFCYDAEIINGFLKSKIRFFDIWDTKTMKYLDYDDFCTICHSLGLDIVPELYRGPWIGKEHGCAFAEGKSTLNERTIREGFVVKPTKERFEPKLNSRFQLKFVGEGYTLSK